MRIALTGADGFLGTHLSVEFRRRGWGVAGLVRNPSEKPPPPEGVHYFHYAFPDQLDTTALDEPVDALVHCAYAMNVQSQINRQAAAFLQGQKTKQFLFISSMSAHPAAESHYGREKLYIESTLDPARDLSIRPGFIIGDGGVFANLARSIRKLPVVPLFYGGQQPIQTVHVDDLCAAIANAIELGVTGLVSYGELQPIPLREFYAAIAAGLAVRRPAIPMPGDLTFEALRIAERLGLRLPMTSENLLGLKRLIAVNVASDIERLGVTPRPMRESLKTVDWNAL
jgi:NADH dehydrogenase